MPTPEQNENRIRYGKKVRRERNRFYAENNKRKDIERFRKEMTSPSKKN